MKNYKQELLDDEKDRRVGSKNSKLNIYVLNVTNATSIVNKNPVNRFLELLKLDTYV